MRLRACVCVLRACVFCVCVCVCVCKCAYERGMCVCVCAYMSVGCLSACVGLCLSPPSPLLLMKRVMVKDSVCVECETVCVCQHTQTDIPRSYTRTMLFVTICSLL